MRVAASLLLGVALLQASSQAWAAPAIDNAQSLSTREAQSSSSSYSWPVRRHGDHGHDEEEQHEEQHHSAQHDDHGSMAGMKSHAHAHTHTHPAPPQVPSLQEAGLAPLAIPLISGGGHSHVHSDVPAETHLNESKLLLAKGPEPLSYVEWDFGYGLGSLDSLRRFTSKSYTDLDATSEYGAMGALDTRYRRLLDEVDPEARQAITQDIASRVADEEPTRHTWLLVLHVLGAMVSCFVLLPLALFLRAAESSLAPLASLVYLASLAGSLVLSSLYKALTPQLYPKNVHGRMGWAILWISLICFGADVFRLLRQVVTLLQGGAKLRSLLQLATGNASSSDEKYSPVEEEHMLAGEDDEDDTARQHHRVHFAATSHHHHQDSLDTLNDDGSAWAQRARGGEDGSVSPSSTLVGAHGTSLRNNSFTEMLAQKLPWKLRSPTNSYNDGHAARIESWRSATPPSARPASPPPAAVVTRSKASLARSILRYTHVVISRGLVVVCFGAAYTGLAVYTGSCRKPNQNGCLAHGIKGGIFFWYGLLTFARYLGAYADCGWSWNRRPSPETASKRGAGWKANMPSAEWVECLVIFIYGATNTWMERFDAKSGDPYTVKQVQHISIAVMYWFAGALGVLLETRWVRNLLSFPVALTHPSAAQLSGEQRTRRSGAQAEADQEPLVAAQAAPPSYSSSFNPFPALCIGVTGVAMAAHHQDYVYEVQIHSLWGQLLAAFALLRCITYFFLWLRPPSASILPSRPPTEALASFCLASGGLVFMISTEDVSFAAMRNGFGDFMAILCITVAFICFVFALIAALFVVKAWAIRREYRRTSARATPARPRALREESSEGNAHEEVRQEEGEAVFVLGEDGEDEVGRPAAAAASRHLSQSPDNLV